MSKPMGRSLALWALKAGRPTQYLQDCCFVTPITVRSTFFSSELSSCATIAASNSRYDNKAVTAQHVHRERQWLYIYIPAALMDRSSSVAPLSKKTSVRSTSPNKDRVQVLPEINPDLAPRASQEMPSQRPPPCTCSFHSKSSHRREEKCARANIAIYRYERRPWDRRIGREEKQIDDYEREITLIQQGRGEAGASTRNAEDAIESLVERIRGFNGRIQDVDQACRATFYWHNPQPCHSWSWWKDYVR